MYKSDKVILKIVFIAVLIFTYILKINFEPIASDCISIVSFAMAIYTMCIGGLIGSKVIENMENEVDNKLKHLTKLGVLKKYITSAMVVAIVTLLMSCISKLSVGNETIKIFFENIIAKIPFLDMYLVFSAICFSFFLLNFVFIILIFIFIINQQLTKK